jgi:branched-chain amino acid transport system substrate-binding protein
MCLIGTLASQEVEPYHSAPKQPLTYNGSERNETAPSGLSEVRIGFFGPEGLNTSEPELLWQGANLALEKATATGGYKGLPFRLVSVWAQNPWAGGAAKLIRAIYDQQLWAIIGGVDGSTTHLAEQVTTKAQLVLINPAATDRTIHAANVPWMFSCVPGEHAIAPVISNSLREHRLTFALLSSTEHDARTFTEQLKHAFDADRIGPAVQIEFDPLSFSAPELAARVAEAKPEAVVVIADSTKTANLISQLKRSGFLGPIFAGPWLASVPASRELRDTLVPRLGELSPGFRQEFTKRYGHPPDYGAAHAYDAANILVSAIRAAGLNRARILDAIRAGSPFHGVTGSIQWDSLGQNLRAPRLEPLGASAQH